MAYSDLPAKSSGDVFGLSEYNIVRDNFDAGMPDIVSAKGDLGVGTGPDAIARLAVGSNGSILVADSSTATGLRWQIVPHCLVTLTGAFDPDPDGWRSVDWDAEGIDTHGMHSTVSNPARLVVPAGGAGRYRVGANVGFVTAGLPSGQSGFYGVRIVYNGTTVVGVVQDEVETPGQDVWMFIDMPTGPGVGDYYVCQVWTSRDIDVHQNSRFWAEWQRV